jgi:cell division protein FtsI/penicillin-binding protein 2
VQIENASNGVVATVATISKPVSAGAVRTTIDLSVQAAAQAAADRAPNSSVVVIQPSTGDILAVANNPSTGVDTAMIGALAPGSTFKPITTTLLLGRGLLTGLDTRVQCPRVLEADGIALHNSEDEEGMDNSFLQDFAQSCNNAFSGYYQKVTAKQVAQTAAEYYGFNEPWDVGLNQPTTYGNVPDAASDSVAEELVGQDRITTSPLAMASVAATIDTGTFEQPILIPGSKQRTATPLPASTTAALYTLMHSVVTQGTLAGVIKDTDAYAKTGTAEVGTGNNSWTIAFKGDYAICALAVDGGFGAAVAGPEANAVLGAVAH